MENILDILEDDAPEPQTPGAPASVYLQEKWGCEPVDAPEPWDQKPECGDEVEIDGSDRGVVACVRGEQIVIAGTDGELYAFAHTDGIRVVRKAELRVRDFVEERPTGKRGAVIEAEYKSDVYETEGLLCAYHDRSDLILLHRGAEEPK